MKIQDDVALGAIQRELYIDAAPEIVFDVISKPEHVAQWWPDAASYTVQPGAGGEVVFGDPRTGGKAVRLTVMEVQRPTTFCFRWTHGATDEPAPGNSLLVSFNLEPAGPGTLVRFIETGFREMGWDETDLEAIYSDHVKGWNHFLPRLAPYAETVGTPA